MDDFLGCNEVSVGCWRRKSRQIIPSAAWAFAVLFFCSIPCIGVCKGMAQRQQNSLLHLDFMNDKNQRSIRKYTVFPCIAWKPQTMALFLSKRRMSLGVGHSGKAAS